MGLILLWTKSALSAIMIPYMKRSFAGILLLVLTAITLMGFLAMEAEGGEGCLAVIASGGACLADNSPWAIANFHLNFLKSFSIAVFVSILLLAAARNVKIYLFSYDMETSVVVARFFAARDRFVSFCKRHVNRWLAIHENSPGFSF